MSVSTIYLICFIIPVVMLIWIVESDGVFDLNQIFLLMFAAIGNIGQYALSKSRSLSEALLSQKIIYAFGVFSPLIIFLMVCDLCRYRLKRWIALILYFAQAGFYVLICTIGQNKLYYESVAFHMRDGVVYLTKVYGPLHILYPLMMLAYLVAAIVTAAIYVQRNSNVNRTTVDIVLCSYFTCIAGYLSEKALEMRFDMLPILHCTFLFIILIPVTRLKIYSVTANTQFMQDLAESSGFVFFDKKLNYMGSNEFAKRVFPEFREWIVDRRLPGSGGRFNTYLRQDFMKYIGDGTTAEAKGQLFTIDNISYRYSISRILSKMGRPRGYMIEITQSGEPLEIIDSQEETTNDR